MQQTGTLRKRRKRNLAKVNGLSDITYDESLDSFTGRDLYGQTNDSEFRRTKDFFVSTEHDIRLQFTTSSIREHWRSNENTPVMKARSRVTRDPRFFQVDMEYSRNSAEGAGMLVDETGEKSNLENLHFRSHFHDQCTMRRLKQVVWLGSTSGAFPWTWNDKLCQIDKWGPSMEKVWKIQWAFFTVLSCFLCIFQMFTFYKRLSKANDSYRGVFQSYMSLHWYLYDVISNINLYYYKEPIRTYINTMLAFNRVYVQKYVVHLNGHKMNGRWAVNWGMLTKVGQVFVTIILFLRMPYQSWYLFSYIYPKPWYWLIPGVIQEYTVVGQVMTSYILILWILVAHSNTLQFWLREIHKENDSDYTTEELRYPKNSFETYKALLVLNQVFNDSMAPMATPLLKISSTSALITCAYVLIRSVNHVFLDEFPAILSYPIGVWDCVSAMFVLITMTGAVFDLGCGFIDSWSRTKQKDFRRVLISCPAIKVWVGRFYFLTVSTTMTFFKIVFDIITDFIIACP